MTAVLLVFALTIIAPTVFVYFLVIKGTDRFEPEPFWLLTLTFLWGAVVATLTAIVGNAVGEGAVSAALGAGSDTALVRASTASFVAPLVEETTKGAGLLFLWLASVLWLRELDGAIDGAIYGGVIGLGYVRREVAPPSELRLGSPSGASVTVASLQENWTPAAGWT